MLKHLQKTYKKPYFRHCTDIQKVRKTAVFDKKRPLSG
nr:MAG TPA: hypothetical protein [Caudoviricetes sp.]